MTMTMTMTMTMMVTTRGSCLVHLETPAQSAPGHRVGEGADGQVATAEPAAIQSPGRCMPARFIQSLCVVVLTPVPRLR